MQTKCLELSECSLILQERWCLSGSTSKHSVAAFKAPPGGWQYCRSTSLGPTPAPPCQSPQGCPPGDGALQMGISHVCSSCSSQSVLFNFIYVCVCVCVECMCMCMCMCLLQTRKCHSTVGSQNSPRLPLPPGFSITGPCLPLEPSLLLLLISHLVAHSSFVCLVFLFSKYASLILSPGALA